MEERIKKYYKYSDFAYSLILSGIRHIGYYPEDKKTSHKQALINKMDLLAELIDVGRGSVVVDAGCGEGHTAEHLASKYGYKVKGIDLFKKSIDKGNARIKKNSIQNVKLVEGNFNNLPQKEHSVDALYCVETFTHTQDADETLKEFHRVLKPGGKLVIFDYETSKPKDMDKKSAKIIAAVSRGWAAPLLLRAHHGYFEAELKQSGYKVENFIDITRQSMKMFDLFRKLAFIPYAFIRLTGTYHVFPNATLGFWWSKLAREKNWTPIAVVAIKTKR